MDVQNLTELQVNLSLCWAADVLDHEYKVNVAIEMFTQRIKWCLQGSPRMFGLLQGSRIGLALDCSDANMGFGRHIVFLTALLHLLDEQIVINGLGASGGCGLCALFSIIIRFLK